MFWRIILTTTLFFFVIGVHIYAHFTMYIGFWSRLNSTDTIYISGKEDASQLHVFKNTTDQQRSNVSLAKDMRYAINISQEQEKRQKILNDACSAMGQLERIGSQTYERLLVDEKHKTMYCFVPKAGCTTWKLLLLNLTHPDEVTKRMLPGSNRTQPWVHKLIRYNTRAFKYLKLLKDFPNYKRRDILRDYFKLIVVRHPWKRLLSAFSSKLNDPIDHMMHAFKNLTTNTYTSEAISRKSILIDFLEMAADRKIYNAHLETVSSLCNPCAIRYDYIAHVETMTDDFDAIMDKMNVTKKHGDDVYLPHSNISKKNETDISLLLKDRPDIYRKLLRIYSLDFQFFGYEPE